MDKSKFKNIRENFSFSRNSTLNLEPPKTTIIDQIPHYNSQYITSYIDLLNLELNEQNQINSILKDENFQDNINQINTFITNHSENVDSQLETLKILIPKLKDIVNENNKLKDEKKEYNELIQSSDAIEISNKMKEIKKLKNDISSFLELNGI